MNKQTLHEGQLDGRAIVGPTLIGLGRIDHRRARPSASPIDDAHATLMGLGAQPASEAPRPSSSPPRRSWSPDPAPPAPDAHRYAHAVSPLPIPAVQLAAWVLSIVAALFLGFGVGRL